MQRSWRDLARRRRKVPGHSHPRLRRRIEVLERDNRRLTAELETVHRRLVDRLAELESGLQEERSLSPRVAELVDLVTTLVAAAARGEEEFRRALDEAAPVVPDPQG